MTIINSRFGIQVLMCITSPNHPTAHPSILVSYLSTRLFLMIDPWNGLCLHIRGSEAGCPLESLVENILVWGPNPRASDPIALDILFFKSPGNSGVCHGLVLWFRGDCTVC